MDEKIYTTEQIAELLQLPTSSIQRFIRNKKMSAHKIGKYYRVTETELAEFLQSTSTNQLEGRGNRINKNGSEQIEKLKEAK